MTETGELITRTCRDCGAEYPFTLNCHQFSWWVQLMFCPSCREKLAAAIEAQHRAIVQEQEREVAKDIAVILRAFAEETEEEEDDDN